MITAILWVVLASGHATEPLIIEGTTCAKAVQSLRDGGYKLKKGNTLYCTEAFSA